MAVVLRMLLMIAFVTWMIGWFWAFTFARSDSFFEHHLGTRLTFLLLALLSVAVPPLSDFTLLKRVSTKRSSALSAAIVHLLVTISPIFLYWAAYASWVVVARRSGRIAFEADETMGIGIDFAVCIGLFVVANVLFWLALPAMQALRKRSMVDA